MIVPFECYSISMNTSAILNNSKLGSTTVMMCKQCCWLVLDGLSLNGFTDPINLLSMPRSAMKSLG